TLSLNGWDLTTLNQPNLVSVLKIAGGLNNVQFTDANSLDLQGISVPGKTVILTASGPGLALTESSGTINAAKLSLNGWGPTSLIQANNVGVLAIAGGQNTIVFNNGINLDVQGISAPGQSVTLNAIGAGLTLTESSGIIDANP